MEEALLNEMIRDREILIQFLKKKVAGQEKKAKSLGERLAETAETKHAKRTEHRAELMMLWKEYDGLLCRYQDAKDSLDSKRQLLLQQQLINKRKKEKHNNRNKTEADQQQQEEEEPQIGPDIELYNEIMKDVVLEANKASGKTSSNSSNYVVRMQSQLCKAMHGMGIMETQRQMTKGQMEQIQKKANDVLPEMIEEKSHVELKMVNDLIFADNGKREVESKRNLQHETFFKEKNDLMEKIERQIYEAEDEAKNNGNNDGDNDENDAAEEEAAKEELQGILQEGKTEMERLEKLIRDKESKVEELKISAAMAQGQDVVDDIVTSIAEEFADGDGSGDEGSEGY